MKLVLFSILVIVLITISPYLIHNQTKKLSKLPSYNVDITQTSTSGISSGGFMAVQIGYAFSSNIVGVGVVAGGPYICAEGEVGIATSSCMSFPEGIYLEILDQKAQSIASSQEIDSLDNIKKQNIYIYSGTADTVVKKGVVEKCEQQYKNFGAANVTTEYGIASEHAWITDNYGNQCSELGTPYINNCGYNQAQVILNTIYGTLLPGQTMVDANLMQFDQTPYQAPSMGKIGYIYVPTTCKFSKQCKVHIAFHGCNMNLDKINDQFVRYSGLNEIGEANNIIILYPQASVSTLEPSNPEGCWDWWGYDDGLTPTMKYVTKSGKQMAAVDQMLNDLAGQ